jgi:hypothetical protein
MTSTNLSANPMPEYVLLDIEAHEPLMTWLCEEHDEDEALLYPALVDCLFEKDGEFELAYFMSEYKEQHPDSERIIPVMSQLSELMLIQIKQLHLYGQWYLNYKFDRLIPGAIVLRRLTDYSSAD